MSSKRKLDSSKEEQSITPKKKQNVAPQTPPSTPKKGTATPKKTPKKLDPEAEERKLEGMVPKTPSKQDAETTTPSYHIGHIAEEPGEMFSHEDFNNCLKKTKYIPNPKTPGTLKHLVATEGTTELKPTLPRASVSKKGMEVSASKETADDEEELDEDWEDVDEEDRNEANRDDASPYSGDEDPPDHRVVPPRQEDAAGPAFVFRFTYDKAKKKLAKIPRVKEFDPQWSKAWDIKCDHFAYNVFTYQDAFSPQDGSATQLVYTAPIGGVSSLSVMKDVFIPVEELQKRLCGSPEQRLEAYIQDWKASQSQGKDNEDGSHLQVYNLQGQAREREGKGDLYSLQFLRHLFPTSDSNRIKDIPAFIFERWCRVAYIAARAPKKAFDINSRFWSHAYMEGTKYGLSPPENMHVSSYGWWSKAMEATLINRNDSHKSYPIDRDESKISRQDPTGNAPGQPKGKTPSTASNETKGPTNADPSKAGSSKGTSATKASEGESSKKDTAPISAQTQNQVGKETVCFILDKNFEDYIPWGQHPQGFYFIWIHKNHRKKVYPLGTAVDNKEKLPGAQFSAAGPEVISGNSTEKDLGDSGYQITNNFCKTKTILDRRKIRMAEVSKRHGSQNQIMGALSANDVAKKLEWTFTGKLAAEWLHKSAYSFGGVGNHMKPGSQQDARNLVFGTIDCNTAMIIYESYLKRLTRYLGRPIFKTTHDQQTGAPVTTSIVPPNKEVVLETCTTPLGKNYWLSESLRYTWSFTLDNAKQKGEQTFPLFSLNCPTMFEAELHEAFDVLWMGSEEKGKDAVEQGIYWKDLHDWLFNQGQPLAKQ